MAVSITEIKPGNGNATAVSDEAVRVTVTGVDVDGQMFRRPARILSMDGRDCMFRSDRQPETGGSVLIEFDYRQADHKHKVLHASVKSTAAEAAKGFYTAVVEFEVAQAGKVLFSPVEVQTVTLKSVPPTGSPSNIPTATGKGVPPNGTPRVLPDPSPAVSAKVTGEVRQILPKSQAENPIAMHEVVKSAVAAEIKQEINLLKSWISRELENARPEIVSSNVEKMIREAVEKQVSSYHETSLRTLTADIARQVEDRMPPLRNALESMTKKLVEEKTEASRTAGDRVEDDLSSHAAAIMRSFEESTTELAKKISDEHTALLRGITERTEHELSSRVATIMRSFEESTAEMTRKLFEDQVELSRNAGERAERELTSRAAAITRAFEESTAEMTRKLYEDQAELTRTAGERAEGELSSRAAAITGSFEQSAAEMEARVNLSRAATEDLLIRSQSLRREIDDGMLPLRQALRQLHDVDAEGIQKLHSRAALEMSACAAQFKNQLDDISRDRAIGFATEIESRMVPNQQQADELFEKLGAVFQLLQNAARVQQERLAEQSKTAAANFEKEIRSILIRFAGGVQD